MVRRVLLWQSFVLLLLDPVGASDKPTKRVPTLAPGDGRPRNWANIAEYLELEWVQQEEDCARNSQDGDQVFFNHKGFIAELPPGKDSDFQGRPLRAGMQIDSNIDPQTKEAKPLDAIFGVPRLIVGMEAALRLMCADEVLKVTIPGPLAYNGRGNFLPYNTKVMYELEVVEVKKGVGIPKEEIPNATGTESIAPGGFEGPQSWPLAVGLLVLLLVIMGGGAYTLSSFEQQGQGKKKAKDVKKDSKKKR
eukprot:TRINITY_DN33037_c0_g1_i1.p1 TRINITY_DN33037_c0_g1~~TRINITY_DN33037_c0_g1_i1.p1  ORF type:complete len:249 (+),score=55.56 TRINITY_DN33037_c0_g1_i1:35-781(+)